MSRRPVLLLAAAMICVVLVASRIINRRPFPPDTIPEGAYARIALAIADRRPRDTFAYLETEAQWACYTIRDGRRKAFGRVQASYPAEERAKWADAWGEMARAPDAADVFSLLAVRRGWIARLERDLSGTAHVEIHGERATVVTARGTRYPFRRRENGIWGLTIFTAELAAEAEHASRDLEMVERAAADYDYAKAVP